MTNLLVGACMRYWKKIERWIGNRRIKGYYPTWPATSVLCRSYRRAEKQRRANRLERWRALREACAQVREMARGATTIARSSRIMAADQREVMVTDHSHRSWWLIMATDHRKATFKKEQALIMATSQQQTSLLSFSLILTVFHAICLTKTVKTLSIVSSIFLFWLFIHLRQSHLSLPILQEYIVNFYVRVCVFF